MFSFSIPFTIWLYFLQSNAIKTNSIVVRRHAENEDVCSEPVITGNCLQDLIRYHYDEESDECKRFSYTGCGGNGNRFLRRIQCRQKCVKDLSKRVIPISDGRKSSSVLDRIYRETQDRKKAREEEKKRRQDLPQPPPASNFAFKTLPNDGKCPVCDPLYGRCVDGKCECVLGYEKQGRICVDINECSLPGACPSHSKCVNTVGSFICECDLGMQGNKGKCDPSPDICEDVFDKKLEEVCDDGEKETRYYFDASTTSCKTFQYAGCETTSRNIFADISTCEAVCAAKTRQYFKDFGMTVATEATSSPTTEENTETTREMTVTIGSTHPPWNPNEDVCGKKFDEVLRLECIHATWSEKFYWQGKSCHPFWYDTSCDAVDQMGKNFFDTEESCEKKCGETEAKNKNKREDLPIHPLSSMELSSITEAPQHLVYEVEEHLTTDEAKDEESAHEKAIETNTKSIVIENIITTPVTTEEVTIEIMPQNDIFCRQPLDPKLEEDCSNDQWEVKWFFNFEKQACKRFWFGGCETNSKNVFVDLESCKSSCGHLSAVTDDFLRLHSHLSHSDLKLTTDTVTEHKEERDNDVASNEGTEEESVDETTVSELSHPFSIFSHSTEEVSEQTTTTTTITTTVPPETTTVTEFKQRDVDEAPVTLSHSHPTLSNDPCEHPFDTQLEEGCAEDEWQPRSFFDMKKGDCRRFWYGGCASNSSNIFDDQQACRAACAHLMPTVKPEGDLLNSTVVEGDNITLIEQNTLEHIPEDVIANQSAPIAPITANSPIERYVDNLFTLTSFHVPNHNENTSDESLENTKLEPLTLNEDFERTLDVSEEKDDVDLTSNSISNIFLETSTENSKSFSNDIDFVPSTTVVPLSLSSTKNTANIHPLEVLFFHTNTPKTSKFPLIPVSNPKRTSRKKLFFSTTLSTEGTAFSEDCNSTVAQLSDSVTPISSNSTTTVLEDASSTDSTGMTDAPDYATYSDNAITPEFEIVSNNTEVLETTESTHKTRHHGNAQYYSTFIPKVLSTDSSLEREEETKEEEVGTKEASRNISIKFRATVTTRVPFKQDLDMKLAKIKKEKEAKVNVAYSEKLGHPVTVAEDCMEDFDVNLTKSCMLKKQWTNRYYYDRYARVCRMYWWDGCFSNSRNNYPDEETCKWKCEGRHPKEEGRACLDSFDTTYLGDCRHGEFKNRYYFDLNKKKCVVFHWGGCRSDSQNFFVDMGQCQELCESPPRQLVQSCMDQFDHHYRDSCTVEGRFNQYYFFDHSTHTCRMFWYGNCRRSSQNIFPSLETCQWICERHREERVPSHCQDKFDSRYSESCGNGLWQQKWYFDHSTGSCTSFWFDQCVSSSQNIFPDEKTCRNLCEHPGYEISARLPDPDSNFRCLEDKEIGQCKETYPAYYYNRQTKKCEPFAYSGCGGTANRFLSLQQCEGLCYTFNDLSDPEMDCYEPLDPGYGRNDEHCMLHASFRFYFDREYGSCSKLWYLGCGGNANNFYSYEVCQRTCRTQRKLPKRQAISTYACFRMPADRGKCNGNGTKSLQRWTYKDGKCMMFTYSGCAGNSNRFTSIRDCEQTCSGLKPSTNAEICSHDADWGTCNQLRHMWYYDSRKGGCSQFLWGGCGGNKNRFETFEKCQKECEPSGIDPCYEPLDRGKWCEAMSNRYYFNKRTKECKGFHYTGCGNSGNNFHTIEECETRCARKGRRDALPQGVPLGITQRPFIKTVQEKKLRTGQKKTHKSQKPLPRTQGYSHRKPIEKTAMMRHEVLNGTYRSYYKTDAQWFDYALCLGYRYNISGDNTILNVHLCALESSTDCFSEVLRATKGDEMCAVVRPFLRGVHLYSWFFALDVSSHDYSSNSTRRNLQTKEETWASVLVLKPNQCFDIC